MRLVLAAMLLAQGSSTAEQIGKAVADAKLKDAKIGIVVRSEKAGRVIFQREEAEPLTPASNTKLLTTSCALAKLGADHAFKTTVGMVGEELHVFGGGDPHISGRDHGDDPTAVFKGWAKALGEAKVTKVAALVLHPDHFDRVDLHPDWIAAKYDQDAWWCAPVGALSLNDNCVDLLYEAGEKAGDPVKITVRPETKYVTVTNRATTVASKPKPFGFVRKNGTNEILANGELQAGTKQRAAWIAIQGPAEFFGAVLKETLERAGIAVGEVKIAAGLVKDVPALKVVAVHETRLGRAVQVCNTVSQNFYAEMICKTLGAVVKGEGTTAAGTAVVSEWLKSIGVEAELSDGSGLSRKNRCSAAGFTKLLGWWRTQKEFKPFVESLAVSGTDPGTLKRRMASIKGKVRAKTGHIDGVAALSGYVETEAGDTMIFSILVNGGTSAAADRMQDAICEILAKAKGD
jgi:D-alanyl-D-alanine carboxypeptidase/D-alanyl-D-alanine-endopeptidase (penicillin-binding protein 4)